MMARGGSSLAAMSLSHWPRCCVVEREHARVSHMCGGRKQDANACVAVVSARAVTE